MFWKCRRFANLQSVKQYCINKLQNLVVLTQWQRVHVSVRCAQSWRESHERRTHFLKTGVTIDLWVSDVIVYCSQLFTMSGKLKPWTTRIAYGQKCHVSESYKFKNNIKNLNQSIILFVNCPVYGFQKFSVSFKWTNFNTSQIIMQWMKHFEFRRFFLQVLSSKPQLIFYRSRYLRLPYFRLQEFRLIESWNKTMESSARLFWHTDKSLMQKCLVNDDSSLLCVTHEVGYYERFCSDLFWYRQFYAVRNVLRRQISPITNTSSVKGVPRDNITEAMQSSSRARIFFACRSMKTSLSFLNQLEHRKSFNNRCKSG